MKVGYLAGGKIPPALKKTMGYQKIVHNIQGLFNINSTVKAVTSRKISKDQHSDDECVNKMQTKVMKLRYRNRKAKY